MSRIVVVVPCYNEAARLQVDAFRRFIEATSAFDFIFVDDGSTDGTPAVLGQLHQAHPRRIEVLPLTTNQGKMEAVRRGMLAAIDRGCGFVAYWDADLATPLDALPQFIDVFERREKVEMVVAARVRLLGRTIERRAIRHYLGRVFATAASLVLDLEIYDTQCGAKMFRTSQVLRQMVSYPFRTRWIFDVELIARFQQIKALQGQRAVDELIYELPLRQWTDAPGSKVRPLDFFTAFVDLVKVYWHYKRGV